MSFKPIDGGLHMKPSEATYKVSTPGREPVIVTGSEKLDIVQAAARLWHVPWTSVARACMITPVSKK